MNLLTRVVIWGVLFCFPVAASANEQNGTDTEQSVELGVGLICNSEAQVERYLALNIDDEAPDKAIKAVNAEANDPNACALASIAFWIRWVRTCSSASRLAISASSLHGPSMTG